MTRILLILLFAVAMVSCSKGGFKGEIVTPHYSIFYSEEFAKRFSLPVEKAVTLSNTHLKAIAISIREIDKEYKCGVHLYYDDTIKLYSANDQSTFYSKSLQEWVFVNDMSDEDFQYNDDLFSRNGAQMLYRSKAVKTKKGGIYSSIGYSSYKEHFFPNLNTASLDVGCHLLTVRYGDAEIWIQKAGLGNYRLVDEDPMNIKQKENNYRFDVPVELLKTVAPQIDKIFEMDTVGNIYKRVSVQYGKLDK